jgi:hypothetical protein
MTPDLSPEDRATIARARRERAQRTGPLLEQQVTAAELWTFLLDAMTADQAQALAAKLEQYRHVQDDQR